VERPWKLGAQAVIAVVAIVALAWLWNLLFDAGSWAPGLAEEYSNDTWVSWILIVLAILLVIEIVLLKPSYRTAIRSVGIVEFEIQARADEARGMAGSDDYMYLVGCTGCGTVFDRRGGELGTATFTCPNCGRGGILRDRQVHKAQLNNLSCYRCGNPFRAYHPEAECPVCHAINM
jgi:predicted RNA-binding Zn-ribbon protein involved in translation (DUF1610 family)